MAGFSRTRERGMTGVPCFALSPVVPAAAAFAAKEEGRRKLSVGVADRAADVCDDWYGGRCFLYSTLSGPVWAALDPHILDVVVRVILYEPVPCKGTTGPAKENPQQEHSILAYAFLK